MSSLVWWLWASEKGKKSKKKGNKQTTKKEALGDGKENFVNICSFLFCLFLQEFHESKNLKGGKLQLSLNGGFHKLRYFS